MEQKNNMEQKIKIMIVEDDEILAKEIGDFLIKWGYEVIIAQEFENIFLEFSIYMPWLILMDINLPYYDGFYWCHQIRQSSAVPVIYISSRNDDKDKIMGIAQGGDDYIEKPFGLELLKAKIEAILRRTYQYKIKEQIFLGENLSFDSGSRTIFFKGKEIELTKSEKRIMAKLLEYRPEIVTRDELMMELWDTDEYVSDGTLTTIICRLRGKLKEDIGEEMIKTKKGQGYFII